MPRSVHSARLIAFLIVSTWSVVAMPAADVALAGSYRYAGGDAEVKALFATVEDVVKKMNVVVRGIARKRLRKPNMPSAELTVSIDSAAITVARTGLTSVVAPRNGAPGK
jgi:hypothetical protein